MVHLELNRLTPRPNDSEPSAQEITGKTVTASHDKDTHPPLAAAATRLRPQKTPPHQPMLTPVQSKNDQDAPTQSLYRCFSTYSVRK